MTTITDHIIKFAESIYYRSSAHEHQKALSVQLQKKLYNRPLNQVSAIAAGTDNYKLAIELDGEAASCFCSCPHYNLRLRPNNNRSRYWEQARACKHLLALSSAILESFVFVDEVNDG